MLVLLPPSEGKTAPTSGTPLDLDALSFPQLARARSRVLTALVRASRRRDAAHVLGTGPSLAGEVTRNVDLRTAPTAPAGQVYSGVLYAAAGLESPPDDSTRTRAETCVLLSSALWGAVRPGDLIPAYRLSISTDLAGTGPLAAFWRPHLRSVLDPLADEHLLVDCRSSGYAAMWQAPQGGPGHVAVRVLREAAGRRTVVSHAAKHTRGVLTRHLLERAPQPPDSPASLLDAAGELVGTVLLDATLHAGPRSGWVLELVVT